MKVLLYFDIWDFYLCSPCLHPEVHSGTRDVRRWESAMHLEWVVFLPERKV